MTDRNGNATVYAYDAVGNLSSVKMPEDGTFVTYEYDANGNVTKMTDERGNSYTLE